MTATSDRLFLLSYSEIVPTSYFASSHPWTSSEGFQYEAFKGKVTENHHDNSCLRIDVTWYERSVYPNDPAYFLSVYMTGSPSSPTFAAPTESYAVPYVCPAWCF